MKRTSLTLASAALLVAAAAPAVRAQTAYGYNSTGTLFRFDVNNPTAITTIGQISSGGVSPFTPKGIDFNPATGQLFALYTDNAEAHLFTINLTNAVATATPMSFGLAGTLGGNSYNLQTSTGFGFDVNPKTLQTDGSIRIRVVSNNGSDLRLNSTTGGVAAVDPTLNFAAGSGTGIPSVVGAAYSNNFAAASGATTLYDFSDTTDSLYTQNPPNNGTLNLVGALGRDITLGAGFDIFTSLDGTTNTGYFTDGTTGNLYRIGDLTTGANTIVGTFGNGVIISDLAVLPVPEPSTYAMILGATILGAGWLRRSRRIAATVVA